MRRESKDNHEEGAKEFRIMTPEQAYFRVFQSLREANFKGGFSLPVALQLEMLDALLVMNLHVIRRLDAVVGQLFSINIVLSPVPKRAGLLRRLWRKVFRKNRKAEKE